MDQHIYTVLDMKAGEYGPVFLARNDALAARTVLEAVRGPHSIMSRYPEDFRLDRVGDFDTTTGEVKGLNSPVAIATVEAIIGPKGEN